MNETNAVEYGENEEVDDDQSSIDIGMNYEEARELKEMTKSRNLAGIKKKCVQY